MSARRPSLRVLGAIVVLVSTMVVGPLAGGIAMGATTNDAGALDDTARQQSTPTENNSTKQHENPDEVGTNGDLAGLYSHLLRQLAKRLVNSSIQLSQGQYELARRLLGEDFLDDLEKYVDIAGEIDREGTGEDFKAAQNQQREYSDTVQEFRNTFDAYQEARENGNQTKARRLARKLHRLASDANRTHGQLIENYHEIENETGANLTIAIRNINKVQGNLTNLLAEVNETTFVETRLTVSASDDDASFTDPVTLTGQLKTANGSAVDNETIRLDVGSHTYTVTTDAEGRFQVSYRPIRTDASKTSLTIRYVPDETSVYLGSATVIDLEIDQTTATISITNVTKSAGFGDTVVVSGVLTVNGTPVPGIPLDVVLAETKLGAVTTATDGSFTLRTSLPVSIPLGNRSLLIAGAATGEAITVKSVNRTVQVHETKTVLSITKTQTEGRSITLAGRLTTANGTPISGQPVEVRVNGTLLATVRTGPDGAFRTTVEPTSAIEVAKILLEFTGAGTNLGPSQAETTVSIPVPADKSRSLVEQVVDAVNPASEDNIWETLNPASEESIWEALNPVSDEYPWFNYVLAVLVAILIAAGGVGIWRNRDAIAHPVSNRTAGWAALLRQWWEDSDDTPSVEPVSPIPPVEREPVTDEAADGILATARDLSSEGRPNTAIQRAYASVRSMFDPAMPAQTHWEFFNSADVPADRRPQLRELTTLFEQAAFGPTDADEESARTAIETAETLVGEEDDA